MPWRYALSAEAGQEVRALRWNLRTPSITDIAVVGGGIVGLSIAWRSRQHGFAVTVIDAGRLAGEASSAGAGMLAPGGEANAPSDLARDTVSARRMYAAFVSELEDASGEPMDFRECGAIEIASDDVQWELLQRRRLVQQSLGIEVEENSVGEARRKASLLKHGDFRALWYPGDAIVAPKPIAAALRVLLERHSARLIEGRAVKRVTSLRDGYDLEDTSSETIVRAQTVVLAAGAWASQVQLPAEPCPDAPPGRPAFPIRGHLIQCRREAGTLGPIVREKHLYVFQRNNGDVVSGSNEERVGFERKLNPEAVKAIRHHTDELLPGLFRPGPAEASWMGFRPGIEGDGPEVRRLGEERIWLAYGHYRNGILLAPHTAARVASEIAD